MYQLYATDDEINHLLVTDKSLQITSKIDTAAAEVPRKRSLTTRKETTPLHLPAKMYSDPYFSEAHDVMLFYL